MNQQTIFLTIRLFIYKVSGYNGEKVFFPPYRPNPLIMQEQKRPNYISELKNANYFPYLYPRIY